MVRDRYRHDQVQAPDEGGDSKPVLGAQRRHKLLGAVANDRGGAVFFDHAEKGQ